jgi:hypothetical protein
VRERVSLSFQSSIFIKTLKTTVIFEPFSFDGQLWAGKEGRNPRPHYFRGEGKVKG